MAMVRCGQHGPTDEYRHRIRYYVLAVLKDAMSNTHASMSHGAVKPVCTDPEGQVCASGRVLTD